jgi:hypothetical protein
MSSPAHGSPWWSAEKDFALLMLLTGGNRKAAQRLWLRKVRIHREAPPDAGASAPKAATAKPQPAPARAQAVPKLETAAQLARRARSQIRLRQKHLASKIWASVRIASRLLAWSTRAKALRNRDDSEGGTRECRARALDGFVGYCAYFRPRAAAMATSGLSILAVGRRPILVGRLLVQQWPSAVGRLLVQQWPSARARSCPRPAALPAPSTSSTVAAQPQPALALAAPPPPSQPPPSALAAAARVALDACELQEDRGSKRNALTRTPPRPAAPPTPPPPAEPRKKTRGGGLGSAFAAAAPAAAAQPPHTATDYHAAALAAADPNRRFA